MRPSISVVIPYYNEVKTITTTLERLLLQTLPPKEVILVNSSSTDLSSQVIDQWISQNRNNAAGIEFRNIFQGTSTPSSSKNAGILAAQYDLLAFMDCDIVFEPNWLESQWKFMNQHLLSVVSGFCFLKGVGVIDRSAIAQTYGYQRLRPVVPSTLVKKSVFTQTGLFRENRRAGYDVEWPLVLKKLNIMRGLNPEVVIKYNKINFGDSIAFILKKSIAYSCPTVALKHYYIPYYYLGLLALFLLAMMLAPLKSCLIFSGLYLVFRGFIVPIRKSQGFALYTESYAYFLTIPFMGLILDLGRMIGILKGVYKYHIQNH